MSDSLSNTESRRSSDRAPLDGSVTVRWPEAPLAGSGENISPQGVFFVADEALKVFVRIPGQEGEVEGELVRIQSMGEGKTGIAVRFRQ